MDEIEDGGRAAVIEEGIAALIFDYGRNHNFLDGARGVDETLLKMVRGMSAHLEVAEQPDALWQSAIVQSFAAWRQIVAAQGGMVEIDRSARTLRYVEAVPNASATAAYPYGVSRVVGLSFLAEVCVDRVIARLQTSGRGHGLPAN